MHLNLIAPIGETGYGVAGWNIFKALNGQGHAVALFPRSPNTQAEKAGLVGRGLDNAKKFRYDAPSINIWHQYDLAYKIGNGPSFGFPFFELDRLEDHEVHHINYPDHLIVASKWAKKIVDKYRDGPTSVVPLGIDPNIFLPAQYEFNGDRPYTFLNVGKWEVRKGHDVLSTMFNKAFTPKDNVELWLLPGTKYFDKAAIHKWTRSYMDTPMGMAGKIKIFGWQPSVFDLLKRADCGIFPARAEGWNLELLEMMAIGKPVIATNYSAHTEFCTPDNSFLVDISSTEEAFDGNWFFGQGKWARMSPVVINRFCDYLGYCYENKIVNNPAGIETGKLFTWDNTASELMKVIKGHR